MGQRKELGNPWERFGPLWEKKGRVTALQIAICDDEPAMLEYLDALVNQWGGEQRGAGKRTVLSQRAGAVVRVGGKSAL